MPLSPSESLNLLLQVIQMACLFYWHCQGFFSAPSPPLPSHESSSIQFTATKVDSETCNHWFKFRYITISSYCTIFTRWNSNFKSSHSSKCWLIEYSLFQLGDEARCLCLWASPIGNPSLVRKVQGCFSEISKGMTWLSKRLFFPVLVSI